MSALIFSLSISLFFSMMYVRTSIVAGIRCDAMLYTMQLHREFWPALRHVAETGTPPEMEYTLALSQSIIDRGQEALRFGKLWFRWNVWSWGKIREDYFGKEFTDLLDVSLQSARAAQPSQRLN